MNLLAPLLALLLMAACAEPQQSGSPDDEPPERIVLTREQPRAQLDPKPEGAESGLLELSVGSFEFSGESGVQLRILRIQDTVETEVARVTPFPAKQPGKFLVRVCEESEARSVIGPGSAWALELIPVRGTELPEGSRVVCEFPTWHALD